MNGLFAYGTLKKNELAFDQIENLVDSVKSVKLPNFEIGIRDGLPVIFVNDTSIVVCVDIICQFFLGTNIGNLAK